MLDTEVVVACHNSMKHSAARKIKYMLAAFPHNGVHKTIGLNQLDTSVLVSQSIDSYLAFLGI